MQNLMDLGLIKDVRTQGVSQGKWEELNFEN